MARQWLSLIAAMWLQSINGTNSTFPAYSSELKTILLISQLQLNNLAFASDAGKLLGWLSGIAAAHLPLWLVLLIGSLLGLIGYGLQFLFLTNQLSSLSYTHIFMLTVLAGNSICWINTVCYIIAIKNFPLDRQIAVGLSTSYVGLSAKIYTNVVDVIIGNKSGNRAKVFLLVNSVLPLLVCVVVSPLATDVYFGKMRKLATGFLFMFVITIFTGLFAVFTSLGSVLVPGNFNSWIILGGMSVLLLMPLVIPVVEKTREKLENKCLIRVHDEGLCFDASIEKGGEIGGEEVEIGVHEEIGPKVMLRRLEFWLYFMVYFFGATIGLVYLNNLGQIAESRGCSATSSLVSLSSAFSFFGRLVPFLIDHFLLKNKCVVSRAATIGFMMAPMCGAFFLLTNGGDIWLYISTAIIGVCTGAITSITVSTTTELFGAENFGVNHNILVSNIPVGSFLFGDAAALIYRRGRVPGDENCMGEKCYQATFLIWGFLCVLGTLLAFVLHARTKKLNCSQQKILQN